MKYKAIGGSWDGRMIGFEGERTEKYFQTPAMDRSVPLFDPAVPPLPDIKIENYSLCSMVEVRPTRNKNNGGIRNEPVGEVSFYLNSPLHHLNDTKILQLLIDQHKPQPDNGENNG